MAERCATVAPSYMQVFPSCAGWTGASPIGHVVPRLRQVPSSQRYWAPAWQLAEPVAYARLPNWHGRAATNGSSGHERSVRFQSPSMHLYSDPDWQDAEPCENIALL